MLNSCKSLTVEKEIGNSCTKVLLSLFVVKCNLLLRGCLKLPSGTLYMIDSWLSSRGKELWLEASGDSWCEQSSYGWLKATNTRLWNPDSGTKAHSLLSLAGAGQFWLPAAEAHRAGPLALSRTSRLRTQLENLFSRTGGRAKQQHEAAFCLVAVCPLPGSNTYSARPTRLVLCLDARPDAGNLLMYSVLSQGLWTVPV